MKANVSRSHIVRTIAAREVFVKLRDKGFLISTGVFLLIIAAVMILPAMLSGGTPEYRLAVAPDASEVAEVMSQIAVDGDDEAGPGAVEAIVTIEDARDNDEALTMVTLDEADAALVVEDGALTLVGTDAVPADLVALATIASAHIEVGAVASEAGLTGDQVQRITAPTPPTVSLLDAQPDRTVPPALLVFIFGFLFYFAVLTFGISIAQSVVEEKQSRVVELLVAAVPVRWLLAGKVAGNTLMAVGQVTLIVAVGIIGAMVTGSGDIMGEVLGASGWFLAFFLLGFLMLACLWAVAGSLSSRIEDLQNTTVMLQIAVMAPFFAALLVTEPGTLQRVLSYFPITSPLVMPARVVNGNTDVWEPWVAAIVVLATAALFIVIGARLYAGSVLNTGNRVPLLAAWRQGRTSG